MGLIADALTNIMPPEYAKIVEDNVGAGSVTLSNFQFQVANPLILTSTVDASDSQYLGLSGASSLSSSRAAGIQLNGNEFATNPGAALFYGTGIAFEQAAPVIRGTTVDGADTGSLTLTPASATGIGRGASFVLGGAEHATYPAEAALTANALRFTQTTNLIATTTADESDNARLTIAAAKVGNDITRGASISLNGNESIVTGGASAGGAIQVTCSQFNFEKNVANEMVVAMNTVDTADSGVLKICGGGTSQISRGSYIALQGNESSSNKGCIDFFMGNVTGSLIRFRSIAGVAWTIFGDTGNLQNDNTNGGNFLFKKNQTGIQFNSTNSRAGVVTMTAGSIQISGLTLTANSAVLWNVIQQNATDSDTYSYSTEATSVFCGVNYTGGKIKWTSSDGTDTRKISYMIVETAVA